MARRRTIGIVVSLAVAAAAALGLVHLCRTDPAFYGSVVGSYKLPQDKIRLAFRRIIDNDLPEVVRNARGIWFGGREPQIFVRFDTDAAGIACIQRMFDIPQARREMMEGARLSGLIASGWTGFPAVQVWQEKTGTRMLDPNSLGAGRRITYDTEGGKGWVVYIDDEHGTVYIYFWPYT